MVTVGHTRSRHLPGRRPPPHLPPLCSEHCQPNLLHAQPWEALEPWRASCCGRMGDLPAPADAAQGHFLLHCTPPAFSARSVPPSGAPQSPDLSLVLYPFLMDGEHLGARTLSSSVDSQQVAQSLVDEPSSLGSLRPSEGLQCRMLKMRLEKTCPEALFPPPAVAPCMNNVLKIHFTKN